MAEVTSLDENLKEVDLKDMGPVKDFMERAFLGMDDNFFTGCAFFQDRGDGSFEIRDLGSGTVFYVATKEASGEEYAEINAERERELLESSEVRSFRYARDYVEGIAGFMQQNSGVGQDG